MQRKVNWINATIVLLGTMVVNPNLFGQRSPTPPDQAQLAQHEKNLQELQQALNNTADYVDRIVRRWEDSARASGKWNNNYSADLSQALMKLRPETLIAAGQASSYEALVGLLSGHISDKPSQLGSINFDMVYTPVTPCRLFDTRPIGARLMGFQTYDIDGSNLSFQGGSSTGCGIPFNLAYAAAITITVINPVSGGYIAASGLPGSNNFATLLYDEAGEVQSTTTITPDIPGVGNDATIYSSVSTDVAIDIIGYFARPAVTPLNCVTANSAETAVPVNSWTAVDATCPTGFTATGGGWFTSEGSLGYPGVWVLSIPGAAYSFNGWRTWVDNQTNGNRNVQTWAQCCQVPGHP